MGNNASSGPPVAYLYTGEGRIPAYLYTGEGRIPWDAEEVEVHPSVTVIPDRLFQGCDRLRSLLLREGLLRIGRRAFAGCSSLRGFRCPSTVTEIGVGAFERCWNLAEVELHEGLQSIEGGTFWGCTSLEEVRIPATVARIGDAAFSRCTNLRLVELREGLRWIGRDAFRNCRSLESLLLPSSVEDVGEEAFVNCSSLTSVQLQEDLEGIGRWAFRGCTSLERFEFVRLSERMEAVALDERTASMLEGRLNEITNVMVGESDNPWEECKGSLRRAHDVLTYWELKGATTMLELALWRKKLDQRTRNDDVARDDIDEEPQPSRRECRVKCGADNVIPQVLEFFSFSTTWS